MSTCPGDTVLPCDQNCHLVDTTFLDGFITDLDLDLDSPIWSDLNISDEGLGSPGDSISLDDCFQENNSLDGSSSNVNSQSPGGLTPPYTPATSDRSTPPTTHGSNHDTSCTYPSSTDQTFSSNSAPTLPPHCVPHFSTNNLQYFQPQIVSISAPSLLLTPVQIQPEPVLFPATNATFPVNSNNHRNLNSKSDQLSLKEARRIRNRESANNSRLKQKETMEQLKKHVSKLEKENTDLKHENCQLKLKLKFLEEETLKLKNVFKSAVSGKTKMSKKRVMSFLVVMFILGFNFGPLFNVFNAGSRFGPTLNELQLPASSLSPQIIKESHGRVLLWTSDSEIGLNLTKSASKDQLNDTVNFIGTGSNSSSSSHGAKSNDSSGCTQKYFNKTESIRMENDLRGWVQRVKSQRIKKGVRDSKLFEDPTFKKPTPFARMKQFVGYNAIGDPLGLKINSVFKNNMEKLLESIQRRSDTFYFVSFSAMDTLLLPAESNGTVTQVRPRFSLIMPSLSTVVNETDSNSGVNSTYNLFSMMQIDCEVMNTQTVVVKNLVAGPGNTGPVDGHHFNQNRLKFKDQKKMNVLPKVTISKTQLKKMKSTNQRKHLNETILQ